MGQQIYRFRKASSLATLALLVAALAIAGSLFAAPPDAAGQSSQTSPCRKETGISYFGGKGSPYFTGIPNATSYAPATVVVGKRTVVRNLIDVSNTSETASCDWRVTSKSADWVTLNSESGSLSPDSHHTIRVSINDSAKSLRPGIYQARIQFQLGPEADKWNGYARVTLEILDKCYIKVKDTKRLDIRDGGRVAQWEGTIGRPLEAPLRHRVVVWNSSNSRCDLSAESSARWLDVEFESDNVIGKYGKTALTLSANDRWNYELPGSLQAAITIRDAISGGTHRLYIVLETEHPPCQLAVGGAGHLQFDGVARSTDAQEARIQLENRGAEECQWRARSNQPWLEVTPDKGSVWGDNIGDPVAIGIVNTAANELKSNPNDGPPHSGAVTFSYLVRGITKTETVTVALRLAKPPCQLRVHTPEDMEIHYTRGEAINPERHHLKIQVSNAEDSQNCAYEAKLPNWLETDADAATGTILEGESREITVRLKADTPEAQAAKQEYDGAIVFAVDGAPDKEVPVTLETGCPAQEACAYLHTTHTRIQAGDSAEMTYAVSSPLNTGVTTRLTLELPSGWSIDGEGFADKCSGICTAIHEVPAGDQKSIAITAYANHPGQFDLEGRAEYVRQENGRLVTYAHSQDTVTITVLERESAPREQLAPTNTPTPMPTATPNPTATPVPVVPELTPVAPSAPLSAVPFDATDNSGSEWSRTDRLMAGVIGTGGLLLVAFVIGIVVLVLLLRPRRQRPAVPPTSQRRPPPGQWSARPAAPNQPR